MMLLRSKKLASYAAAAEGSDHSVAAAHRRSTAGELCCIFDRAASFLTGRPLSMPHNKPWGKGAQRRHTDEESLADKGEAGLVSRRNVSGRAIGPTGLVFQTLQQR
ncbi:hypothetical protein [Ancylobacter sp. IITR112]|uniref:hypothetical protein n=1 Tax=Ancylobacter sp. IITR112 TaxID=3138073 RepID=UPI00352B4DFF